MPFETNAWISIEYEWKKFWTISEFQADQSVEAIEQSWSFIFVQFTIMFLYYFDYGGSDIPKWSLLARRSIEGQGPIGIWNPADSMSDPRAEMLGWLTKYENQEEEGRSKGKLKKDL